MAKVILEIIRLNFALSRHAKHVKQLRNDASFAAH